MIESTQLERSKAIQRRTGRTFHLATRLLPERVRHATYVQYAFFRLADDVVDDPDAAPPNEQRATLDRMRREALGELSPTDPVLAAFQSVRDRHDIPDREVEAFFAAMERDVDITRYETYADLEDYLRGSSVAVANMMLAVMDPADVAAARPHAKALGEAFQLTNFLRDVREDVQQYGRVYLPQSTLAAHGVTDEQLERLEFTDGFAAAMRAELARTERRYREGVAGIEHLPEDCQFAVLLSAVLYAEHHRLIRAQGYDVLSRRPSLSLTRRIELLARTWWHWRRSGDPEATFAAVSAVPAEGEAVADRDAGAPGDAPRSGPTGRLVGALLSRIPLGASK